MKGKNMKSIRERKRKKEGKRCEGHQRESKRKKGEKDV